MKRETTRIPDADGLHLRRAAEVVRAAMKFKSEVTLRHRHGSADARSIMQILLLEAGAYTELEVTAHGPDEKEAVRGIVEVFDQGAGI